MRRKINRRQRVRRSPKDARYRQANWTMGTLVAWVLTAGPASLIAYAESGSYDPVTGVAFTILCLTPGALLALVAHAATDPRR